jgi:hypothetical protein
MGQESTLMDELRARSTADLLAISRGVLTVLRERQIIRSGNSPTGDYAETLVLRACQGSQAPNSQKSWDVLSCDGEQLQVKSRVIANGRGERQLSTIMTWNFHALVIVLFDSQFRVMKAARIPVSVVQQASRPDEYVGGNRVSATPELLSHPEAEDWTERLQAAAAGLQ